MLKDKIVIGSLAGIISSLVKDFPALVLYKLGITKLTMIHVAASVMYKTPDIFSPLGFVTGTIGDIITGGVAGILATFILTWMGFDYWYYKGLLLGSAIWFFGFGAIINLGITHINPSIDPVFRILALFDHLLFGFLVAFIISYWYKKRARKTI